MACVTLALFQWSRGTGSGPGCWRGRQELLCVSNHNKTPGDTDPSDVGRVNAEARIRFQVVQESVQSRNMTQRSQHEGDQHKKDKISDSKAQEEKGQSLTRSRNGQRDRTGVSSAAANGPAPPTPLISTKTGPVPQKCTIRTHEIFSACCQWEAIPDLCPPPPKKASSLCPWHAGTLQGLGFCS